MQNLKLEVVERPSNSVSKLVITSALAGRLDHLAQYFNLRDIQDYLVARLRLHTFRQDSSDDQNLL